MIMVLRIPSPPWVCIAVSLLLGVLGLSQAEAPAQTPPIPQVRISGSPDKESRSGTMASSARSAAPTAEDARAPFPPTLLAPEFRPIDLNTALRLAGVQNPQLMIARQRVVEAAALRQLAAVQILPSINFGMNYDSHTGTLQQSNGNILSVNRSALYVGAGSGAVAAGTVSIPGVVLEGNVAVGVLRLSDLAAGGGAAAVRLRGDPEPDVPSDHAGLLRTAPGRGPARRRASGPRRGEAGRRPDGRLRQRRSGPRGRRPPGADRARVPARATFRRPRGRSSTPRPGSVTS